MYWLVLQDPIQRRGCRRGGSDKRNRGRRATTIGEAGVHRRGAGPRRHARRQVVYVCAAIGTASALGVSTGIAQQSGPSAQPAPAAATDPRIGLDTEQVKGRRESALVRQRQRKERRRSPEARAERRERREQFRSLRRDKVVETLPSEYPETLGSEPWQGIDLQPGEKLENYITSHTARIDRPGSEIDAIAESFYPLAVTDEEGKERAVDLTLEQDGNAFSPKAATVDVSAPARLADGIRLPDFDLKLRPQTSNPDATGSLVEGKLLYPNVQTDTDWAVASAPNGVQLLGYLRSASAPEELRLVQTLPAGGSLRLRDQSTLAGMSPSAVDVLQDGQVVASIQPPLAIDAQGEPVQTQYALDGDDVVIKIPHRDMDVAYPIELDPIYDDFQNPRTSRTADGPISRSRPDTSSRRPTARSTGGACTSPPLPMGRTQTATSASGTTRPPAPRLSTVASSAT